MFAGCFDGGRRDRLREAVALPWTECGVGSFRWWETAPADGPGPRAVVIWLRGLKRVTWWIADGELTLALRPLGRVGDQPSPRLHHRDRRVPLGLLLEHRPRPLWYHQRPLELGLRLRVPAHRASSSHRRVAARLACSISDSLGSSGLS